MAAGSKVIIDSTVNCITYSIAFKDTNNDGQLSGEDWTDLYISDFDGQRFGQITNGLKILDYHFMKDNSELLIEYLRRGEEQMENKKKYFATYNISSRTLTKLDKLHQELNKIEQAIRK